MGDGLNLSLIVDPQPVFSVATADKTWSGFTARLSISCVSLNSDEDPGTAAARSSRQFFGTVSLNRSCVHIQIPQLQNKIQFLFFPARSQEG